MEDIQWFTDLMNTAEYERMKEHPIAYFCAEFALRDDIPTYSGGLGVLAGDIVREAASRNFPLVAVGMFYHEGYLYHDIYREGIMMKISGRTNPLTLDLKPVVDATGKRILVSIPIQDEAVFIQAWYVEYGSVRVYLLDTSLPENSEKNRRISDQLYASSKEVRFKQEMVLGLGGRRLLEALAITPTGYHLNEGHSALLALEVARMEMHKHKRSFQEELDNTKKHIFFTNHTLVAAGNETFDSDLVATLLSGFAKELQIPTNEIIKLGAVSESNIFSLSFLALRMAGKVNAVSILHSEKAGEIWKEHPMTPITNGIHIPTWDQTETNEHLWQKHTENKKRLLDFIQIETGETWDPNTFLIGWARRIVSYKRPLALFDELEGFKQLAENIDRPIRVVISGLSHEHDAEGLVIMEKIQELVKEQLKGLVVYLPGYRMTLAKLLTSGSDIWLNTPVVGFEACGTSGMKAALNGVLPVSTLDGWVAEANLMDVGWSIQSDTIGSDIHRLLREQILPLYYSRNSSGVPENWEIMMKNARDMVRNQFSATHMLKKYAEEFYLPLIRDHLGR